MPLSPEAGRTLDVAVRLNPAGAERLLAILLTAPAMVKRKPADRLGLLGMMVRLGDDHPDHNPTVEAGLARPSLPARHMVGAEMFQREWLAGRLTLAEVADAVERRLLGLGRGPYRHWTRGEWQELDPRA
jgi:hypothetical protein